MNKPTIKPAAPGADANKHREGFYWVECKRASQEPTIGEYGPPIKGTYLDWHFGGCPVKQWHWHFAGSKCCFLDQEVRIIAGPIKKPGAPALPPEGGSTKEKDVVSPPDGGSEPTQVPPFPAPRLRHHFVGTGKKCESCELPRSSEIHKLLARTVNSDSPDGTPKKESGESKA